MRASAVKTVWLLAGAVGIAAALAAHPDASQATALALSCAVPILGARATSLAKGISLLALTLCAAFAWRQPDPLQPVSYVEGVLGLARDIGPLALIFALLAVALPPGVLLWQAYRAKSLGLAGVAVYYVAIAGCATVQLSPRCRFWASARGRSSGTLRWRFWRLERYTEPGALPAPPPSDGEALFTQGISLRRSDLRIERVAQGGTAKDARIREVCMKLSAPLYVLKQQAKILSRAEGIPLNQALDRIAQREGFRAWSLLMAKSTPRKPAEALWEQLCPGELVLLGSRRGQGKTLLSLELALLSMKRGERAAFFTLDFTPAEVATCFQTLGENLAAFRDRFLLDDSDLICADYVISKLATAPPKTLVVIDYLQLLDQRRENPDLAHQVRQLKTFAREREVIVVCLSQIDRKYEAANREFPEIGDVRLPNPLDLSLFDRMCFLNEGKLQIVSG